MPMYAEESSAVVRHLQRALEELRPLHEMPHTVDDTLIDRILAHIDPTDADLVHFIFKAFAPAKPEEYSENDDSDTEYTVVKKRVPFSIFPPPTDEEDVTTEMSDEEEKEQGGMLLPGIVAPAFMLCLAETILKHSSTVLPSDDVLSPFIKALPILLTARPRNSSLQHAALRAAIAFKRATPGRQSVDEEKSVWWDVRQWMLAVVTDEEASVYVRNAAREYLELDDRDDGERKEVITRAFASLTPLSSLLLADSLAALIFDRASLLTEEQRTNLWRIAQESTRIPEKMAELLDEIYKESDWNNFLSDASLWKCKPGRSRLALTLAAKDPQVRDCLVHEDPMTLALIVGLVDSISDEVLEKLVTAWATAQTEGRGEKKIQACEMLPLLTKMVARFPKSQLLEKLYIMYLPYAMKNPNPLLATLPQIEGGWMDVMPTFSKDLNEIVVRDVESGSWETRDSALQLLAIYPKEKFPQSILESLPTTAASDPSPYVRSLAIKLLARTEYADLPAFVEKTIADDEDMIPRLEAARLLQAMGAERDDEIAVRSVPRLLTDDFNETRRCGVAIAKAVIGRDGEEAWKMKQELLRWREDSDIGAEVKEALGEAKNPVSDLGSEELLIELLGSIRIRGEDIDCY